jgi:hypothetical protein
VSRIQTVAASTVRYLQLQSAATANVAQLSSAILSMHVLLASVPAAESVLKSAKGVVLHSSLQITTPKPAELRTAAFIS